MGGAQQPFLYEAEQSLASVPGKAFDPKVITRASWQSKPARPKQEGPLVQLGRHPDAHEVIGGQRKPFKTMSSRTKAWIKAIRVIQLLARFLQLVGATGILVLVILITNIPSLTVWVLRITAGFVIVHTAYAIYHLSRPAGYRTPASSGAYQVFAAFSDLCVLPMYAYGAMASRNNSAGWTTLLSNQNLVPYFDTAFYYTILGSGGLHGFTLIVSFWLAVKFRDIARMPPDMNPLEDRYTSRSKKRQQEQEKQKQKQQHSRNKSSIATADTFESLTSLDNDNGLLSRPPSVPFLHTRMGSHTSIQSHDPRLMLPSQNSPASFARSTLADLKRSSVTSVTNNGRGTYAEVPLNDGGYANSPASRSSYHSGQSSSRPNSSTPASSSPAGLGIKGSGSNGRVAKFTETWNTSDSMINRTQQRNQALNTMVLNASGKRRNYQVVNQTFDFRESDDDVSDTDTVRHHPGALHDENTHYDDYSSDDENGPSHPVAVGPNTLQRTKTPFHNPSQSRDNHTVKNRPTSVAPSMSSSVYTSSTHNDAALSEVPINDRRVGNGYTIDITDAGSGGIPLKKKDSDSIKNKLSPPPSQRQTRSNISQPPSNRWPWAPHNQQETMQIEDESYGRAYGQLKSATPPILVGGKQQDSPSGARQVSSGNDYDLGSDRYLFYGDNNGNGSNTFGRRNVSGKIAEEGRAYSRYSTLNK
ncbi:hypothetical protein SEPCBS119000_004495 [Sporothrix epigloea]|uniref:Uncharacterized protein n=1 Tax=Sporothrix epigloea TaxID=1892477 RepID=A0ABP0DU86_9PEZI